MMNCRVGCLKSAEKTSETVCEECGRESEGTLEGFTVIELLAVDLQRPLVGPVFEVLVRE